MIKMERIITQNTIWKGNWHKRQERAEYYKINRLTFNKLTTKLSFCLKIQWTRKWKFALPFRRWDHGDSLSRQCSNGVSNVSEEAGFASEQLLSVVWNEKIISKIGMFDYLDKNYDRLVRVDHLQCITEGDNCNWKRPQLNNIQDVDPVQILSSAVHGKWNISKRNVVFVVTNTQDVNEIYEWLYQSNMMHRHKLETFACFHCQKIGKRYIFTKNWIKLNELCKI